MRSAQIRSTFFQFFNALGHRQMPSGSLIPNDPTLLLTNAGMVQFKPYFLGEATPPSPRLSSVQKCVRTVDIDKIGRTTRHATSFEMLGNFAFGEYFKTEAIAWAYELITQRFGLRPERLWATVYEDDQDTADLWLEVGIPTARIQRLGREDNFWHMGVPGPCGPCSEIFYDRGPRFGSEGGPAVNSERYLEIWNLVFMEHVRGPGADDFPIVGALPRGCIDTGLGVDRLALILQDADHICHTDLLAPTLARAQELADRDYDTTNEQGRVCFHILTDHARTAAFLIADGVLPSNEGRGYVLRRILRRAIRHARLLGIDEDVLSTLTASVIDNLGAAWPELHAQQALIEQVCASEEEAFERTLRQGSRLLEAAISQARRNDARQLPAETAFELQDTHGFPLDLTVEIARDAGLALDRDRVEQLIQGQRHKAKAAHAGYAADEAHLRACRELAARHGPTAFVGYDTLTTEARVLTLLQGGIEQPAATEGQQVTLVLDRSPFYAEAGGQVGDTGTILTASGAELRINDTRTLAAGLYAHHATVVTGEVRADQAVEAQVDADRRDAVARSHSATHVLHALLRTRLGEHAQQQGSLVGPGRLRFDFAHFSPVRPDQLAHIEHELNRVLLADPQVRVWQASLAQAQAAGATALFGQRYGDVVRVVDIGDVSRELCGGTHVTHGSQVGAVRILKESSIGTNLRRIDALTGMDALRYTDIERQVLAEVTGLLGVEPDLAVDMLRARLDDLATAQRELRAVRERELDLMAATTAQRASRFRTGWLVIARVEGVTAAELRSLATAVLSRCPSHRLGTVVLGAVADGAAVLAAAITPDLADHGLQARDLLATAAHAVGGGAGGKGAIANAGGRRADHLDAALSHAHHDAERHLSQLAQR